LSRSIKNDDLDTDDGKSKKKKGDIMKAEEKFEMAKQRILLDHRFFASLMMRMKWGPDPTCKRAWTNGKQVGYNPVFIDTLTTKKTMGVIVHEIFHPMMKHHLRVGNKNHELWNKACDYAINPVIIKYGFELPDDVLLDERFNGMAAEQIYIILLEEEQQKQEEKKEEQQDQNQDQDGQDQKDQNDQKDDGGDDNGGDDQGNGKSQEEDSDEKGSEGNGQEEGETDEIRAAVDDNGNPADEAEIAKQEAEINIAVTQAAKFAEKAGQSFDGIKRLVEGATAVETPWEQILSNFVYENAKTEYDWSRPSRRHQDFFVPSLHNYKVGNIVLMIDTSGSINTRIFKSFMDHMASILENIEAETWVIFVDDKVQEAKQISPDELNTLEPKGYGGTDFRPGFDWLKENDIEPKLLIYLTDLECNRFPEEPDFPVLWAAHGWYAERATAPFGEKIILK
jgi:predicted metal-dependent peptidase